MKKKVMVVFGTRPEAIKMAPVVKALSEKPRICLSVAVTGQHRQMLDPVLELFGLHPEHDLGIMKPGQSLAGMFSAVLTGMNELLSREHPDLVVVHGDTSTTIAAAFAAFYARVDVAHVEAGLRTGDLYAPWPEEGNRRLTTPLTRIHFAPTARAQTNLLREGVPADAIHITGNTVIDALLNVTGRLKADASLRDSVASNLPHLDPNRRLILLTAHRRENIGPGLENICRAAKTLAARKDVQVVYPLHLNPLVQGPARRMLADSNVTLISPQDYLPFVYLMMQAHLIITDSGGVQEEAPSLGKPVLVIRDTTERPEALEAGTVRLVGSVEESIVTNAVELLDNPEAYGRMSHAHNPYGDGNAAERIARVISDL